MSNMPALDKSSMRVRVIKVSKVSSPQNKLLIWATNEKTNQEIQIQLEGLWSQTRVAQDNILNLMNPKYDNQNKLYSVDNAQGFLVTEPDNLLTCTYVASSLFCERKTWLNHIFLGQVGTNRAMLVGTLVHEVFQHAVKNKITQTDKLTDFLDELLDNATTMLEIYSVELHLEDVRNEAIIYIKSIKEWVENYLLGQTLHPVTNDSDIEVKIDNIHDIEENIWSTKYGLKGKIDVTGVVKVRNKKDKKVETSIIPLELKTGNPNLSSSHSAQVSLYSMMIEDRYAETNQAFVIYLKDKAAMHHIKLTHNIKRDLIQRRNLINYSTKNPFFGPEMIDNPRLCKTCDRLTECVIMSQLYTPDQIDDYSSMKKLVGEAVGHLNEKFYKFFQLQHERLVALMATKQKINSSDPNFLSSSFWNYSSQEAEEKGAGFGQLQAIASSEENKISFKRHPKCSPVKSLSQMSVDKSSQSQSQTRSDSSSQSGSQLEGDCKPAGKKLKIYDYFNNNNNSVKIHINSKPFDTNANFRCRVAISVDNSEIEMKSQNSSTAIAIGFVSEIKEHEITVKLYDGNIELSKMGLMYRIDKIEKRVQADIERIVLVRLLTRENWRCDQIRSLILDPDFMPTKNTRLNHFVLTSGFDEISELEGSQQLFVVDAFSTDNYYILNEKTATKKEDVDKTLAIFARVTKTLDRSMLIVAQNIDNLINLMTLLRQKKIKFILIDDGKSTKARNKFSDNLVQVPPVHLDVSKKFDAYIRLHTLANIVITSYAMSIGGLLFVRRTFDYCVAYDCDKTELLVALSPMFCSDRYIIVDVREEKEQDDEKKKKDGEAEVDNEKKKEDSDANLANEKTMSNATNNNNNVNCVKIEEVSLGDHLRKLRSSI